MRRSTLVLTAIAALVATTYFGHRSGLALAAGSLWSLLNLVLLERLVVSITGPGRATLASARRAAIASAGMLGLFAAGGVLLLLLPPVILLAGFLVPLGVLVLKAASMLVLGSRGWARMTSSPWRAALVVLGLLVVAWWLVPNRLMAPARASDATRSSAQAPAQSAPGEGPIAQAQGGQGSEAQAQGGHASEATATESRTGGAHAAEDRAGEAGPPQGQAAEGHAPSQGPEKFANWVVILTRAFPNEPWSHTLHLYEPVVFSLLVGLIVLLLGVAASRAPKLVPGRLQAAAELAVEGLYNFIVSILGPEHGRRFFPFLATLFIYIFAMNLFGILPFMDSPSSNLNVTFALGITVFLYAQYVGIRALGPLGYADHMMGSPRNLTGWLLVPLMLPIHLLGELAKPISLSCRLFGNIFGEDMLMVAFATLGIGMLSFAHVPFGVPMHAIFYPLALLTSGLQALVFTVLSTIYILLMLPHDEHHEPQEALAHAH